MPGFTAGLETDLTVTTVSTSTLSASSISTTSESTNTLTAADQVTVGPGVFIGKNQYSPTNQTRFNLPGTSSSSSQYKFSYDTPITINSKDLNVATTITRDAIVDPDKNYYQDNALAGIKQNEPKTPSISGGTIKKSTDSVTDIPTFLTQCLVEAQTGAWRETGQNGAPSNQNITGIWPYIGICANPPTGPWASDQTAWCMGFVQFVLKNCGYNYFSTASAFDISNPNCGTTLITTNYTEVVSKGKPGDIILFSRGGGYGHVTFLYKFESDLPGYESWSYVGGNQTPSNGSKDDGDVTKARCATRYAQSNFIGLYRPSR